MFNVLIMLLKYLLQVQPNNDTGVSNDEIDFFKERALVGVAEGYYEDGFVSWCHAVLLGGARDHTTE